MRETTRARAWAIATVAWAKPGAPPPIHDAEDTIRPLHGVGDHAKGLPHLILGFQRLVFQDLRPTQLI